MNEAAIKSLIGLKIKSLREEKDLTQEKFGEIIGIEPANLSNIENGKTYPDTKTLINLIKKTEITPDYLLGFLKELDSRDYKSIDFEIIDALISLPFEAKEHFRDFLKLYKK